MTFIIGLIPFSGKAKFDFGSFTYQDSEIPKILPRSTWENTESLRKLLDWYPGEDKSVTAPEDKENSPPDYFNVERIVIHDMGCDIKNPGCNDKERDPLEIIQSIYRYHSATRGWGDIGYHYIIDYWGNIYEGRYGGNGVRGAHTYYDRNCDNFNIGTIGILLMGNYENAQLPEIMYKSLSRLVAWVSATNSLDPTELYHHSEVWHSPKKGTSCDTSTGALTSSYNGPVVVGHGDIEKGNSDPGTVDLKRARKEARQILLTYKNYLFTTKEDSNFYTISNGQLNKFTSDTSAFKIINLGKHQLGAFLNPLIKKMSDGTLVKSENRDRAYLIEGNKRRPILSEQLFKIKNYKWANVIPLSDRNLAVYPLGEPLIYPDESLIKGQNPEVYLIEQGQRRHITSPAIFESRGFKWENILQASEEELLAHPAGESLLLSDNALIKGLNPEVYLVKSQKRHWIKTAEVFLKLGFKWQNIITLPQSEINKYALGMVIGSVSDINNLEEKTEQIVSQETESIPTITEQEPLIRIGIDSSQIGKIFKITANGPYEIYQNDKFYTIKNKDEFFEAQIANTNNFKFIPKTKDTIFEIISYENHPDWKPDLNDNLFRGNIELKYSDISEKVWIVNELKLEDYLKGLAEAVNEHPLEYIKALIVAARSYSLFHINNKGKYPEEIFHLRDWAFDQLYRGYGFESRAQNIAKAAEETSGVVATFNNKPIRGVYSSDSGGVTKNSCKIWGGVFCGKDYNYLRGGIKDPTGTSHTQSVVLASHGVGISAVGARELAKQGKTYQDILNYYYQGIKIEKIY